MIYLSKMKKLILLALTLAAFHGTANAVMVTVTVDGQGYLLRYRTSVNYNAYESTIEAAPWFGNNTGSGTNANAFAVAAGLRFAYGETTIAGNEYALYRTSGGTDAAAESTDGANYAVSATPVPGPLPLLGVLPFVGFLRKMRKKSQS